MPRSNGPTPAYKQQNSADNTNAANDRPDRHGMFLVLVNFERAQFRHVFLGGVTGVAAVGQHNDADDEENDAKNASWFHAKCLSMLQRTPALD
jgi:hypothetical protein